MKFGSLFAGIGGIDLGLERAGMECAWQVERDDFCQKVLTKHWPDVPKYKDVHDVGKHNLETVDLIAGGFPCQPFSVAGKQRGTEDDRHLWPEMLRVISELKPTWVLGENVPGIIPLFLDQALSDLEAEGYTCEPFVLPACAFDAPHQRYRLFILAYSECVRFKQCEQPKKRYKWTKAQREPDSRCDEPGFIPNSNSKGLSTRNVGGCTGKQEGTFKGSEFTGVHTTGNWRPLTVESTIRGMADGVPNRVDRLKSLGNAVVPQVAEHIGRMILESTRKETV